MRTEEKYPAWESQRVHEKKKDPNHIFTTEDEMKRLQWFIENGKRL